MVDSEEESVLGMESEEEEDELSDGEVRPCCYCVALATVLTQITRLTLNINKQHHSVKYED